MGASSLAIRPRLVHSLSNYRCILGSLVETRYSTLSYETRPLSQGSNFSGQGFNWATIPPFLIFSLQLLLNWLYTPLFFGLGNACIVSMFVYLEYLWPILIHC